MIIKMFVVEFHFKHWLIHVIFESNLDLNDLIKWKLQDCIKY